MTLEEQIKFRKVFKRIIAKRSMVKSTAFNIARLESWNKKGSHENAIKKATEFHNSLKDEFLEMLKGHSYEHWRETSRKLALFSNRMKNATSIDVQQRCQGEINLLKLPS